MQIEVNGTSRECPPETTVAALLEQLQLSGKYVAVERNRQIVSHKTFAETPLQDGDKIEIVTLVGGG
jgi:thiamine biosynthesis protein ThiS